MHTNRESLRMLAGRAAAAPALALALALAACGGGSLPTSVPSVSIPTLPPDVMPSGTSACIDASTMAVIDQLKASGADLPTLLAANKDALIAGLGELESSDPTMTAWRDALVDALESGDMDAAAGEIAKLADDEVAITAC